MDGRKGFRGNIILAFAVKGGSVLTGFLTARVILDFFGNQTVLGIWYTVVSALLLLLNFDLGLGNGLRQRLTRELARGDREAAGRSLSAGLLAYGAMTVLLALLGSLIFPVLNWGRLSGSAVSPQALALSAVFLFLGILLRFFLLSVAAVLNAMQMTSVNNLLALCGSFLQLLFLSCVKPRDAEQGLIWLSAGYALLTNLPAMAMGMFLCISKRPVCCPAFRSADMACLRMMLGTGVSFFVCQMAYMVLMNTNEMLISMFFGPQYTTEYTFYYKLATLSSMVAAPALTPVWSAVAGAKAKGERLWVRSLYPKLKLAGGAAVLGQFAFVLIQQPVMDLWLGGFPVDHVTALVFAGFGGAFTYGMVLSTLVSGLGRLRLQMVCYSTGALLKLLLVPHMSHWRQVVLYNGLVLVFYCVWQQRDLDRCFRES
ncbi:MAG: hypothetical protein IKA16_04715 [Oscillospiraceae bacterium]|nr:hypothetical protein [Oscillospiraceae bacterium]